MEKHRLLTDTDFIEKFGDCTLDPVDFTHEAHLRLAWILIDRLGIEEAVNRTGTLLKNYVKAVGAEDKYNHTVTVAAVRAVHHFRLKSKSDKFADLMIEFPRLKTNFRDLLATHYRTDIFRDEKAKMSYLEPELLPFD